VSIIAPVQGDEHRPIRDLDELSEVFRAAEKPREQFRIGAEAEKFAGTAPAVTVFIAPWA